MEKLCSKLDGGLAFRNLETFNLPLLAKQLWCILTHPKCLVSKVLKAKYFPHNQLFEAQVGTRPSYTWKSIIATRELLRSGCKWSIGIGYSVDVWEDPWIPHTPSFRVITSNLHNLLNLCVSVILAEIREWDVETINAFLWPLDRDTNFQILLSHSGDPDIIIWHYSNNGLFSVRSVHLLALSFAFLAGISDGCHCSRKLRETNWQVKVPK
ncbi:UNVERIFIED_CONTAM: hypothetical protein Sangu_2413300 [Sesamum angustifolium]|uniref:Uncharacterized protein n=1 Tax=Sesamum angustifolium TaxID=2727405 RepID=A0AAW2KZK5_9LAMI